MTKAVMEQHTPVRMEVMMLRYKLENAVAEFEWVTGIELWEHLGFHNKDWQFFGFPSWTARRHLSDEEKAENARRKKRKLAPSHTKSPWELGRKWCEDYIKLMKQMVKFRKLYSCDEWAMASMNDNREWCSWLRKLKKDWQRRPKEARPESEYWARLPEAWQNGVQY